MITKEEYEEAQNIVWDYEEQLKSNVVLDDVIKCEHDWIYKNEKNTKECTKCGWTKKESFL